MVKRVYALQTQKSSTINDAYADVFQALVNSRNHITLKWTPQFHLKFSLHSQYHLPDITTTTLDDLQVKDIIANVDKPTDRVSNLVIVE